MAGPTPMVSQYKEIKDQHKDAILFFRLGDFYEMFNEDALTASRELEITLTGRGQEANRMPMCGIPYHAAEAYIAKLISKGYKVAICEQVEDPKLAEGVVKREVIRVITPGTLVESSLLPEKENNYLLAINFSKQIIGLSYLDYSTGEFKITRFEEESKLKDELLRISPSECLVPDIIPQKFKAIMEWLKVNHIILTEYKDVYDADDASTRILNYFKIRSLEAMGLREFSESLGAAAAILDYISKTQQKFTAQINNLKPYHIGSFMFIDASTRRNLELIATVRDRQVRGSLIWVLDRTKTSMGSRLLKRWLLQPLLDKDEIEKRLDAVEELANAQEMMRALGESLVKMSDIERLNMRISSSIANARDMVALKESLNEIGNLKKAIKNVKSELLIEANSVPELSEVIESISRAVIDDPPLQITDGGVIKNGYNPELDELRKITSGGKQWVAEMEKKERELTGIKSLKVGFTKVFGYYIEVSQSNLEMVPLHYIRKQTLVNCERFITPELKEKEALILNADQRMKELEYKIIGDLRSSLAKYAPLLQKISHTLCQIDCLLSFALTALDNKYVRPQILDTGEISMQASRHPVIERTIGAHKFVPNDVALDNGDNRFLLITGPNMAGKSTYMRQIALCCVLAQIGSFVPAKNASLSIIDRIFTRIGAMDDIFSGQSTFMLEMTETANILNNATENSLIILDEIGRGTATFDGMSIAAAVAEYIHTKIKAKTLFATHYHEITQLADKHPGMQNLNVAVAEEEEQITFLYRIEKGAADKSYGIQVAQLAGLPKEVISRAKKVYATLEMMENDLGENKKKLPVKSGYRRQKDRDQMGLFL